MSDPAVALIDGSVGTMVGRAAVVTGGVVDEALKVVAESPVGTRPEGPVQLL